MGPRGAAPEQRGEPSAARRTGRRRERQRARRRWGPGGAAPEQHGEPSRALASVLTRSGSLALGGAVAALVAGGLFGLVELCLVALGRAALLAIGLTRVLLARLELQIGRHLSPRRVHAGQPARVELNVANHGRRPTPVLR